MAQTVSEFIFQEEKKVFNLLELGEISHSQYRLAIINIEKQAKAIQNQQMIDFAKQWQERQNDGNLDTIEMLYEETYNK